jgi:hypothetical protein
MGMVHSRYVPFRFISLASDAYEYIRHGTNRRTLIDILDDDSLLKIFYYCRPDLLEEDGGDIGDIDNKLLEGGRWERERWWYKLAQVCRRWRHLMLASPSHLRLSLVCTSGTPVADMLAHSPPIPLIIDHIHTFEIITREDKEGILLALKHRDRVRRIRLRMHVPLLTRLIAAIDGVFPLLEYLYIQPLTVPDTNWSLPSTFRAPLLRHLVLLNFTFPIRSPLPTGLVTLSLEYVCSSANFSPRELLQQLSLMPRLEIFRISFDTRFSTQNFEGELLHRPLSTHVTLPNLRWLGFEGPSTYMEAVLPRITMPLLKVSEIMYSEELSVTFSILFALQFMSKLENPRFRSIRVTFCKNLVVVTMYPHERTGIPTLRIKFFSRHLIMGLVSTVQVFNVIRTVVSEVELLTLEDETSLEWHKGFPFHTEWRELLRLFDKVRTLHVSGSRLIKALSRSLRPYDGESSAPLLPELRVLSYPKGSHVGESCRSFIAIRQKLGLHVTLARR